MSRRARQLPRQVHEGERVAAGGGDDLRGRGRVDRLGERGRQQPQGRLGPSPARGRPGTPASWVATCAVSRPANKRDRLGLQPTGDQTEDVERLGVEQVGVVDHAQHGFDLAGGAEEAQHPETHQEAVGGSPSATPAATRSAWRWLSGSCAR